MRNDTGQAAQTQAADTDTDTETGDHANKAEFDFDKMFNMHHDTIPHCMWGYLASSRQRMSGSLSVQNVQNLLHFPR